MEVPITRLPTSGVLIKELPFLETRMFTIRLVLIIFRVVKKPGAFERYKYREDLFPTISFRKAYDRLLEKLPQRQRFIGDG